MQDIGIDIQEVNKIRELIQKEDFVNMIFSQEEQKYCNKKKDPAISYTGKYSVKEAVIKVLSKTLPMKNIEILNTRKKKPYVQINGEKREDLLCSISHTTQRAIGVIYKRKTNER